MYSVTVCVWRGCRRGVPKPHVIALDAPHNSLDEADSALDSQTGATTALPRQSTAHTHGWFLARAYSYLGYSTVSLLAGGGANATACQRALWRFRRAIEDDPRFLDLPDPGLVTMVPFVPLWRRRR